MGQSDNERKRIILFGVGGLPTYYPIARGVNRLIDRFARIK
jgi:hypothetical protein